MVETYVIGRQIVERGWIIAILADMVAGPADAAMVRNAMGLFGIPVDRAHFKQHLEYLEERGYIKVDRIELGGIKNTIVCISAKGRDLRGGLIQDPGVDADVAEG